MKKIILFSIFSWLLGSAEAQINYSVKLPKEQLSLLRSLERVLRETPLPKSLINTDSAITYIPTEYAEILRDFFDTSQIRLLRNPQTYYMELAEEERWLKMMTLNSIRVMHRFLHCAPDSILFVMPASEYSLLEKDDDRVKFAAPDLLVAGLRATDYYYPVTSILFSKSGDKIIYMNFLINFDGYEKKKKATYEEKIVPLIAQCGNSSFNSSADR